ncbi:hypothetical protein [Fluviicola sp.]|uniref:hypothetical protein n=1 Tax=Fluviicola sp. TaxID=1917219 RepID=UPI00263127C2|nr:hypothetical protein [Fluviicola sp.]
METASSFLASGDNVFKFLLTMCIGTILFNIIYPTDKIKEIEIRQSELNYKLDIMNEESKVLYDEIKILNRLKKGLNALKSPDFRKKLESFDLKYELLSKKDYEIKHLRRLIEISRDELGFYSSFRFWSYYPSMVIGLLSLIFWIHFYVKSQKTEGD